MTRAEATPRPPALAWKDRALSPLTLALTALALSSDAFAVAVSRGLTMRHFAWRPALLLAGMCGLFQAGMPVIGWFAGQAFADVISGFDHWIAFGLLAAIGGHMLWEAWSTRDDEERDPRPLSVRRATMLAFATSIDALAVGVGFAFLDVNITVAAIVIGLVTFLATAAGVRIGHRAGARLAQWAELAGGLVLIVIGVKILIEHLAG